MGHKWYKYMKPRTVNALLNAEINTDEELKELDWNKIHQQIRLNTPMRIRGFGYTAFEDVMQYLGEDTPHIHRWKRVCSCGAEQ